MTVVQDVDTLEVTTDFSPGRANAAAITRAASLLGLPGMQITSQGEAVIIAFRSGHKFADVECFDDGDAVAVTYNHHGEPRAWDVDLDDAGIMNTLQTIKTYMSQS